MGEDLKILWQVLQEAVTELDERVQRLERIIERSNLKEVRVSWHPRELTPFDSDD
jgi:hypothetical protein